MRLINLPISILAVVILASFSDPKNNLIVTSPAFQNNATIPAKYTCLGSHFSPPISIGNVPANARSFVIIVYDPEGIAKKRVVATTASKAKTVKQGSKKAVKKETVSMAPNSCYTYWLMWNIDVNNTNIPENFRNDNEGLNSANETGYHPLCPVSGTHYYHFKVFALDTKLNISKKSSKAEVEKVMQGHVLASGELVGSYNKDYK
jgi:Raf kinase inhibitor-like YbhB/YbcL family protein